MILSSIDGVETEVTETEAQALKISLTENGIRSQRNALLAETDWWAVSDRTMTQAETDYRQALRDVPAQAGFPENVTWPTKPEQDVTNEQSKRLS